MPSTWTGTGRHASAPAADWPERGGRKQRGKDDEEWVRPEQAAPSLSLIQPRRGGVACDAGEIANSSRAR